MWQRTKLLVGMVTAIVAGAWSSPAVTSAAVIGVDAVHGFGAISILATGRTYEIFRDTITGLGHTIVPLTSFEAGDLAGLDAIILNQPYNQNAAPYTVSEIAAIQDFVVEPRAVFLSDGSLFVDQRNETLSDRPITFGDNQLLLENILAYISVGGGLLVLADNGFGFQQSNINALVAPFGISYASDPTEGNGHTITDFVLHPVTAGLTEIGIDFQLQITTQAPSISLTTGSGADDALSALPSTGKICSPDITSFATPKSLSLSGSKGFDLTKAVTSKGRLVDGDFNCPANSRRLGEVQLIVRNLSLGTVVFDQTIDTGRKGDPLEFEAASSFSVKHFVGFDASACNGVPVAGSRTSTEGILQVQAIARVTEAGVDQGGQDTASSLVPVTCKAAR